jgi:hypothetical protein
LTQPLEQLREEFWTGAASSRFAHEEVALARG